MRCIVRLIRSRKHGKDGIRDDKTQESEGNEPYKTLN